MFLTKSSRKPWPSLQMKTVYVNIRFVESSLLMSQPLVCLLLPPQTPWETLWTDSQPLWAAWPLYDPIPSCHKGCYLACRRKAVDAQICPNTYTQKDANNLGFTWLLLHCYLCTYMCICSSLLLRRLTFDHLNLHTNTKRVQIHIQEQSLAFFQICLTFKMVPIRLQSQSRLSLWLRIWLSFRVVIKASSVPCRKVTTV